MITLSRVFGIITLIGVLLGSCLRHGEFRILQFVNVLSIAFVTLGTIGILLLGCESGDWRNVATVLTRGRQTHTDESRRSAAGWFRCASRGAISSGVIVFLFSLITMLATLNDPSAIGVSVVAGLLPLLYGTVLSEFLFHPLAIALDGETKPDGDRARWNTACIAVMAVVWVFFVAATFWDVVAPAVPQPPLGASPAIPIN